MITANEPLNSLTPGYIDQSLVFDVNENEIGPLLFDDPFLPHKSLISYDLDLAENATFIFFIVEDSTSTTNNNNNNNNLRLSTEQLNYYFSFGPAVLNNTECSFVVSKSSLNLLNTRPLDYDTLALASVYDKTTGIGTKALRFMVEKKTLKLCSLFILRTNS